MVTTEKGTLPEGILFDGKLHRDFEMGVTLMKHTAEALDVTEDTMGSTEGYVGDMFYRIAVLAASLVSLGDIPRESLTAQLLYDNLSERDFDVLRAARDTLTVKRTGGSPGSPGSDSPSSPSGAAE